MFSSVFVNSVPLLNSLKCSCPKVFSLTKTIDAVLISPLSAVALRRTMSERKGFEPRASEEEKNSTNQIHGVGRYTVFRDDDADIILDVDEERALKAQGFVRKKKVVVESHDEFVGINLERGVHGVYDVEDLVHVLKLNNAESIFVTSVPEELNYANHVVIASGKSKRHMDSLADFVRKVYKRKVQSKGRIPHIEGQTSNDWLALDLGNIILHIMSKRAREFYDLESLWAVGAEYDGKVNDPDDPLITLLEEHTITLSDFQPADFNPSTTKQEKTQPSSVSLHQTVSIR